MRVMTVSQLKGKQQVRNDAPREGTRLRKFYDELLENRGEWIVPSIPQEHRGVAFNNLRDFYGMDIQNRRKEGSPPSWEYRLVGEFIGRNYVSYLKGK